MSGHSKWSTIKHKKGANDKRRAKLFAKLIRQIEVAARQGGADLDGNPALRTTFQKARDNSVPIDTIERAIKRGAGDLDGVTYEENSYEGYAGGGVALFVETLTDNKNRTSSEIKALLTKNGGSMAEPGSVAWQFKKKGVVIVSGISDEDALMTVAIDIGAEDIETDGDTCTIICEPENLVKLSSGLRESKFEILSSDLSMLPEQTVPVQNTENAKTILRLLDALDDHDDVQGVYSNFDIPEDILQQLV